MSKPNGKQNKTSLSYRYQQSYWLQHSRERKEKKRKEKKRKEKKRKEKKRNKAHLWHTAINIHNDVNTLAKGNLAKTQQIRISVILVQQKFTASFLSWTSTILFFLISHDLFHTPLKEDWREYMYLFPTQYKYLFPTQYMCLFSTQYMYLFSTQYMYLFPTQYMYLFPTQYMYLFSTQYMYLFSTQYMYLFPTQYKYLFPTPAFNLPKNRANIIFTVTESCSAESFHTKPQMIIWFQQNLVKCCQQ